VNVDHSLGRVAARTEQARVTQDVARRAIDRVIGISAPEAVTTLSFAAGSVCEPVARVIEAALAHATRELHHAPSMCIVRAATSVRARRSSASAGRPTASPPGSPHERRRSPSS
jgi:hypothetical protein